MYWPGFLAWPKQERSTVQDKIMKIEVLTNTGNTINISCESENIQSILEIIKTINGSSVQAYCGCKSVTPPSSTDMALIGSSRPTVYTNKEPVRSTNLKFSLNYCVHILPDEDKAKININRGVVVKLLKDLIVKDFDYYCKYIKKQERLNEYGMEYWCTPKAWSYVFKSFGIILPSVIDQKEIDRLTHMMLKMLLFRRFTLEVDCPGPDGTVSNKYVAATLRKCRNTENKSIYVFAVREIDS